MSGFSSYDDMINEISVNGKIYEKQFGKVSTTTEAANVPHSLWLAPGSLGAGANPAATPGTQYDDASGSMFFADQASDFKHLITFGAFSNVAGTLTLYDRLVGVSGISVASTGNKTINSAALPRYTGTDSAGVECWLEVTTATTTTAPVVSLNSYTDQDGNTGQSGGTTTFPAAATNVDVMVGPMLLAAGDTGIRSIEVGLNVGTAAAAGVVNVLLLRRLASINVLPGFWKEMDLVMGLPGMPRVYDGASLALMFTAISSSIVTIWGTLRVTYG